MSSNITLYDFMASTDPRVVHSNLLLNASKDQESFIKALYYAIENIVQVKIEATKDRLSSDEELISDLIATLLYGLNYNATRETKSNGSVDITVELGCFTWLCETKILNSNSYIVDGFRQLVDRYSNAGNLNANKGGYFIYNFQPNTNAAVVSYKAYSQKELVKDFPDYSLTDSEHPLRFFTTCSEPDSGLPYEVKHFAFSFHYDPRDKSGKKSKVNRDLRRLKS